MFNHTMEEEKDMGRKALPPRKLGRKRPINRLNFERLLPGHRAQTSKLRKRPKGRKTKTLPNSHGNTQEPLVDNKWGEERERKIAFRNNKRKIQKCYHRENGHRTPPPKKTLSKRLPGSAGTGKKSGGVRKNKGARRPAVRPFEEKKRSTTKKECSCKKKKNSKGGRKSAEWPRAEGGTMTRPKKREKRQNHLA